MLTANIYKVADFDKQVIGTSFKSHSGIRPKLIESDWLRNNFRKIEMRWEYSSTLTLIGIGFKNDC